MTKPWVTTEILVSDLKKLEVERDEARAALASETARADANSAAYFDRLSHVEALVARAEAAEASARAATEDHERVCRKAQAATAREADALRANAALRAALAIAESAIRLASSTAYVRPGFLAEALEPVQAALVAAPDPSAWVRREELEEVWKARAAAINELDERVVAHSAELRRVAEAACIKTRNKLLAYITARIGMDAGPLVLRLGSECPSIDLAALLEGTR